MKKLSLLLVGLLFIGCSPDSQSYEAPIQLMPKHQDCWIWSECGGGELTKHCVYALKWKTRIYIPYDCGRVSFMSIQNERITGYHNSNSEVCREHAGMMTDY